MEPWRSLQFSQKHSTTPSPDPHQSSPHSSILFNVYFNIILPFIPRSSSGLFFSVFPTKTLTAFLLSLTFVTFLIRFLLLGFISRILIFAEKHKLRCSSLCSLLHYSVTPSLLGPNIYLRTLFWNTISLCTSLNVRDQVSHTYKTTGKTTVVFVLIFMSHNSWLIDIRLSPNLIFC